MAKVVLDYEKGGTMSCSQIQKGSIPYRIKLISSFSLMPWSTVFMPTIFAACCGYLIGGKIASLGYAVAGTVFGGFPLACLLWWGKKNVGQFLRFLAQVREDSRPWR